MRICKLCVRACGRLGIPKQDPSKIHDHVPCSLFHRPGTKCTSRHTTRRHINHTANTRRETAHDLIDSTSSVNSRVPPAGIPHSGKPPSPSAMHITWDSSEDAAVRTRKREMTSHIAVRRFAHSQPSLAGMTSSRSSPTAMPKRPWSPVA